MILCSYDSANRLFSDWQTNQKRLRANVPDYIAILLTWRSRIRGENFLKSIPDKVIRSTSLF